MELVFQLLYRAYEEILFRLYHGPVFHRFLNRKYEYYTGLPWLRKLKFLRLVRDHYQYFEFIPRQGLKLTRPMKVIICSGATQVVMSLPPESLTFFEKILVYPDPYNSTYTHRVHKGEVNPGLRVIVFSWKSIMEGLHRGDDGLNLLLHEFAHALWLEHKLMQHQYTVLDASWVNRFEQLAEEEMTRLHVDEHHFFRKYAFQNIEEFFAVAVENFFERSQKFSDELPDLYESLVNILRQDPLTIRAVPNQKLNR